MAEVHHVEPPCQCRRRNSLRVQPLVWGDPLEKEMVTCSSVLGWEIPWTRSLAGYSLGSHRVGHDWVPTHTPPWRDDMTQAALKDKLMSPLPAGQHKRNSFCPASCFSLSSGREKGAANPMPRHLNFQQEAERLPVSLWKQWWVTAKSHLFPTSV